MKKPYAERLPILRTVAREHGYALGLHGSGERDLDLIAAPWTEDASEAEVLVEALRVSINGVVAEPPSHIKPHGRRAWLIYLHLDGSRLYVDLSVMPL
jgi:hypothetical protein